jgi:hypothetical protein
LFVSCEKKDNNDPDPTEKQFESLENPYLICANRNPGGVGFDFEYKNEKGGGNNMDSLTVDDFEYDIIIRTIQAEKPDGSISGAPFIQLHETVKAVNYSTVNTTCKGYAGFRNLNSTNIQSYTSGSDDTGFDLTSVATGTTGKPLLQILNQEYNKLVIGQRWKEAASNDIADDEPIWIIETREEIIIKFIVLEMPAKEAPTSTGYVRLEWDFVN